MLELAIIWAFIALNIYGIVKGLKSLRRGGW